MPNQLLLKITTWSQQRRLQPSFWISLTLAIIFTLLIIISLYAIINQRPTAATLDYRPFASQAEYQQFLKDNPLFTAPEPHNQPFTIDRQVRSDKYAVYIIQLQHPSPRPSMTPAQLDSYYAALQTNQQKALDWIKQQNVNPEDIHIIWRPNPER